MRKELSSFRACWNPTDSNKPGTALARANAIARAQAEQEGRSLEGAPSFDGIRLHDLRHSFASFAVQSGGSLYLVGKVLGHKQSRTTEIYAHASDEPLLATAKLAARRIARALDGVGKADRRVVSSATTKSARLG